MFPIVRLLDGRVARFVIEMRAYPSHIDRFQTLGKNSQQLDLPAEGWTLDGIESHPENLQYKER
jgi:hypothetical protein